MIYSIFIKHFSSVKENEFIMFSNVNYDVFESPITKIYSNKNLTQNKYKITHDIYFIQISVISLRYFYLFIIILIYLV